MMSEFNYKSQMDSYLNKEFDLDSKEYQME